MSDSKPTRDAGGAMTDREAVRRCLKGERDCFAVLVRRHQRECLFHAMRILGAGADAEEVVQEAFVKAFESLARFDQSRPFFPWLYVIAKNACLKRLAGRKRQAPVEAAPERADGSPPPALRMALEGQLAQLSQEHREILRLRHMEGLDYAEIATRLDVPRGTVMSRLHAARLRLRQLWGEDDGRM